MHHQPPLYGVGVDVVQLLPYLLRAVHVAGDGACAQSLSEDSGAGAAALCREYRGFRGHARACASAVERAEKGHAAEVTASAEAARVARHAWAQETQGQRAVVAGVSSIVRRTATILAAQILRFQRVVIA